MLNNQPSIDVPDPPFRTTSAEAPPKEAEVVAHLLAGERRRGKLEALSVALQTVSIQPSRPSLQGGEIPFSDLRYLVFTRHMHVFENADRGAPSLTEGEPVQSFRVTFLDGKSLSGKTRGHSVDQGGLHFFQVVNGTEVARVFIPYNNVKEYHIDSLLGDELVRDRPTLKKDVDAALEKQRSLRHQKIGEYLPDSCAINAEQLKKMLDRQDKGLYNDKGDGLHHSLISPLKVRSPVTWCSVRYTPTTRLARSPACWKWASPLFC